MAMSEVEKIETHRHTWETRQLELNCYTAAWGFKCECGAFASQEYGVETINKVASLESQLSAAREALMAVRPLFVYLWHLECNGERTNEECVLVCAKIDAALKETK